MWIFREFRFGASVVVVALALGVGCARAARDIGRVHPRFVFPSYFFHRLLRLLLFLFGGNVTRAHSRMLVQIRNVRVHLWTRFTSVSIVRLYISDYWQLRRRRQTRVPRFYVLLEIRACGIYSRTIGTRYSRMSPERNIEKQAFKIIFLR